MALVAKLYFESGAGAASGPSGRAADRREVQAGATLRDEASLPIDAEIVDLSTSGCLIVANRDLPVPSIVTIALSGTGTFAARIVRRDGDRFGCAFVVPLPEEAVAAARAVDTVVPLAAAVLPAPASEPSIQRFPVRTRVLIIIGSALAAWGLLIAAIMIVLALV
jgi:hypothetical protein